MSTPLLYVLSAYTLEMHLVIKIEKGYDASHRAQSRCDG